MGMMDGLLGGIVSAGAVSTVNSILEKTGISIQELTETLAQVLPQAVDKMTPDGKIPTP